MSSQPNLGRPDAQREACVGCIQRQSGWTLVDQRYGDGGFTGANIERPAFQRLLADIDAGQIDVVIVYKVNRLSRSLLDFAKVMERFGAAGVSFVSVTQNSPRRMRWGDSRSGENPNEVNSSAGRAGGQP